MSPDSELHKHASALRALALALCSSEHDAEDVVQDAWVAALQSRASAPRELLPWLKGAVMNLSRGLRRKGRRLELREPGDQLLQRAATLDSSTEQAEVALRLARAVLELPESYREVIVPRYWHDQTPRSIAAKLGLSVKVVRNRLHRGLTQLRRTVDHDVSEHPQAWGALAGLPGVGWPLRMKTILGVTLLVNIKAAACLLLLSLLSVFSWFALTDTPGSNELVVLKAQSESTSNPEASLLASMPLGAPVGAQRVVAADLDPEATPPPASVVGGVGYAHRDVGWLRLSVVDGLTGEDLPRLTLRTGLDGNFSERLLSSPIEMQLGGGTHAGLLIAPGLDPLELLPFRIDPGQTTNLGIRALSRGTASLHGRVLRPWTHAGKAMRVELYGFGRGTCANCIVPSDKDEESGPISCAVCGFGPELSSRSLGGDLQLFDFSNLAMGDYQVVLRDGLGAILTTEKLRADVGEQVYVELEPDLGPVVLQLTGAGAQPFEGSWIEEGIEYSDWIDIYLWNEDLLCAVAQVKPLVPAWVERRGADGAPAQGRTDLVTGRVVSGSAGYASSGLQGANLWPRMLSPSPALRSRSLRVERLGPGRYLIKNVPKGASEILIACGPYFTDRAILEFDEQGVVQVQITQRCSFSSRDVQEMALESSVTVLCSSCHQLPAEVVR